MGQEPRARARYYRYGGVVVRLYKGKLEPVRVTVAGIARLVPAVRSAKHYAPLPKHLRRELAKRAEDADRRARVKDMGVALPEVKPAQWSDVQVASGAAW